MVGRLCHSSFLRRSGSLALLAAVPSLACILYTAHCTCITGPWRPPPPPHRLPDAGVDRDAPVVGGRGSTLCVLLLCVLCAGRVRFATDNSTQNGCRQCSSQFGERVGRWQIPARSKGS